MITPVDDVSKKQMKEFTETSGRRGQWKELSLKIR